jgi:hypothetical protein
MTFQQNRQAPAAAQPVAAPWMDPKHVEDFLHHQLFQPLSQEQKQHDHREDCPWLDCPWIDPKLLREFLATPFMA